MVGVKHYLFFICVFQWLDPWQRKRVIFLARNGIYTDPQPIYISSQHIHQDCFCNIISVVAGDNLATVQLDCSSFQGLSPQHSAISAVVGLANGLDDLVHSPAVELLVRQYFQGKLLFFLIAFDGFERIISVSFDAFVDSQHIQLYSVLILFIEFVQNMHEHSGVLASTGTYCYLFALLKQLILKYGLVYLGFEGKEEAVLADRLLRFGSLDHGLVQVAGLATQL